MTNVQRAVLEAAEIGLANMVSYQSSGQTPSIHEYGQARRALDAVRKALAEGTQAVEIEVWFGSMPESNGRENWTVTLRRKARPEGASKHDLHRLMSGVTVYRSEYKDRARYEADRLRHLLGLLDVAPDILDYDADLHSGYVPPKERT